MGLPTHTSKTTTTTDTLWGMGFLLVFFPSDHPHGGATTTKPLFSTTTKSSYYPLLAKAQSTISICALLIFITLLVFTLSTFDPATTTTTTTTTVNHRRNPPRRWLSQNTQKKYYTQFWKYKSKSKLSNSQSSFALQGLGSLYLRGTTSMDDLVVGHVSDDVSETELRLFLRTFLRSGVNSKSDIVFIFPSTLSSNFNAIILEETESFLQLVRVYRQNINGTSHNSMTRSNFDVTQFVKSGKKGKEKGESLWGKKTRANLTESTQFTEFRYGSVVSFTAAELDPEDALAGFLGRDSAMKFRRWACFPMLLGRVRRSFKHIMLVNVKEVLILSDPLGRVRTQSPESVSIFKTATHKQKHQVNSAILMGGTRGIRRLSSAMLTEIVRAAIQQHKGKNSVPESSLLSQLVRNEFLLRSINLVPVGVSVPDSLAVSDYGVVQRGNSNQDLNFIIMKQICSFALDSSVYSDCL